MLENLMGGNMFEWKWSENGNNFHINVDDNLKTLVEGKTKT